MSSRRTLLEPILMRAWMQRGWLARVLLPLAFLYRMAAGLRRWLFHCGLLKSTRLSVPVVVVGNIFVGGTGKTPFAIWLVDALRMAGYVPGVVSRGYGVHNDAPREVKMNSSPQEAGDEPVLIAQRAQCPVMVGRNRVAAANALLLAHPEVTVIVADDGLQHYALQREVEIVLFDARGIGNGWMLPAGPLREPKSRRGDFTVVNAPSLPTNFSAQLSQSAARMQLVGVVAERLSDRTQRKTLAAMMDADLGADQSAAIVAAAGIGNPARFFLMLRDAGLIFQELPLPDHYDFSVNPFADVSAGVILITEKDAVKCAQLEHIKNDPRLWVVPVTARIEGALAEQIVEKLRGRPTA